MPRIPYEERRRRYEERLRSQREETFVRSPTWKRFADGWWRRYRGVRLVTKRDSEGRFRAGFAVGITWRWTDPCPTGDDARRALLPLIEAYATTREAAEKAADRAEYDPLDFAEPTFTREELEDLAEPAWTKEELADFAEETFELTDDDRQDFADFEAEMAELAKSDDWTPSAPPADFPPLPPEDDPFDGY